MISAGGSELQFYEVYDTSGQSKGKRGHSSFLRGAVIPRHFPATAFTLDKMTQLRCSGRRASVICQGVFRAA